jgi:hypothetical protein
MKFIDRIFIDVNGIKAPFTKTLQKCDVGFVVLDKIMRTGQNEETSIIDAKLINGKQISHG